MSIFPEEVTPQQYADALADIEVTDAQRRMAIAHAMTPIMTARHIGEAGGQAEAEAWRFANAHYGGFASRLADRLQLQLPVASDGREVKTAAIATAADSGPSSIGSEFRWKVRRSFVEGLVLAGWLIERPSWLDDDAYAEGRPTSLLPIADGELTAFKQRSLWLTSQWGFLPEYWGYLGFTKEEYRAQFVRNTKPGVIVGIYATFQSPELVEERGHLLGFLELTHEHGDARDFSEPAAYKRKQRDPKRAKKWNYGLRASRAWRIPRDHQPLISDVAPLTYASANPQYIGSRGVPFLPADVRTLAALPVYEASVYGEDACLAPSLDAAARVIGKTSGVDPGRGQRSASEPVPARHLYILELRGNTAAYLGWDEERVAGRRIVKVGLSFSPDMRREEIQRNYPKGAFQWEVLHSTAAEGREPYPTEAIARSGEDRMKEVLTEEDGEAHFLGGEFYLATGDEIITAWVRGKGAAHHAEQAHLKAEQEP